MGGVSPLIYPTTHYAHPRSLVHGIRRDLQQAFAYLRDADELTALALELRTQSAEAVNQKDAMLANCLFSLSIAIQDTLKESTP